MRQNTGQHENIMLYPLQTFIQLTEVQTETNKHGKYHSHRVMEKSAALPGLTVGVTLLFLTWLLGETKANLSQQSLKGCLSIVRL